MVKNLPANAEDIRDLGLIPGLGRSPGEGNGNSLQYSCLKNSMNRGYGGLESMVSQSQTQVKQLSMHTREGELAERHNVHLCESSRSNGRRKV